MYRGNHGRIEINEVIGTIAAPARCPVTPHPAEWSAHETACHSPKQVNFRTSPVNAPHIFRWHRACKSANAE